MRCRAMRRARSTSPPCAKCSQSPPPPIWQGRRNRPASIANRPSSQKENEEMLSMTRKNLSLLAAAAAFTLIAGQSAMAQKKYDTGATDSEIKLGNVEPYRLRALAYGTCGQ